MSYFSGPDGWTPYPCSAPKCRGIYGAGPFANAEFVDLAECPTPGCPGSVERTVRYVNGARVKEPTYGCNRGCAPAAVAPVPDPRARIHR